jgi:hypothetical protein
MFGRRLVWSLYEPGGKSTTVLPDRDGWIGLDERPIAQPAASSVVGLWHPAEASPAETAAWRATLAARNVRQPFRQVDREVFALDPGSASPAADRRFAGRLVDHGRLRALLRTRDWAVPALGAWDLGDEATGWRAFDDGLRAELRYQAVERAVTGERVERARIVAVRFIRTDAPPTSPATTAATVVLADVPARAFSEALRDVSLVVIVGEEPPRS